MAANDSLGLCIFGMTVTNPNTEFLVTALNAAHGTRLTADFFEALGREALRLEYEFDRRAGFTEKDDEPPPFFSPHPLRPRGPSESSGRSGRRAHCPENRPIAFFPAPGT